MSKELSNPFSTGGGGPRFENQGQTAFVILMLAQSACPALPPWPIHKIKLQGRFVGYETDDFVVFAKDLASGRQAKLLAQVKHAVSFTESGSVFGEVIQAAWQDFCNPRLFQEGNDQLALITGPLSATDTNNIRALLEWARNSEDADEFITKKVERAKFSSDAKRAKLRAFRAQLAKAKGSDVSDDELWRFMKSYHLLGYDLDVRSGVALSLLHALISSWSPNRSEAIWSQVAQEVQSINQNAGTVTAAGLPEPIREAFRKESARRIPEDIAATLPPALPPNWQASLATEVARANLVGAWSEQAASDRSVVERITNEAYDGWIRRVREVLQAAEAPLKLSNGVWSVGARLEFWRVLGSKIFDDDLERFRESATHVLGEQDPKFELPPDKRFQASVLGKDMAHSRVLRRGVAETLALLGSHPDSLSNCSRYKAEATALVVVRELLTDADWVTWASLNDLLPLLAEAAPDEFLNLVERALASPSRPFSAVFAQEGTGVFGGDNYMTGLLWALEGLAWSEAHLSRVTVILGGLAEIDPGGNWANRPLNSLVTIFLPWLPQTSASVERRQAALTALRRDVPDVAWSLLKNLLPNQHQVSSGSYKPKWRDVPTRELGTKVDPEEYWQQVDYYIGLAVELAKTNLAWLIDLLRNLQNVVRLEAINELLTFLASDAVAGLPEAERYPAWFELDLLVRKHKRFQDAAWALSLEVVEAAAGIARSLEPSDPLLRHRRLFSNQLVDLFDEQEDYQKQEEALTERQLGAIEEILDAYDVNAVVAFASQVENSFRVGIMLGKVGRSRAGASFLPSLLLSGDQSVQQFTTGFVAGRFSSEGWGWLDELPLHDWSPEDVARLYIYHRFFPETWQRVADALGENEGLYWRAVKVNPYAADDGIEVAVDKLLEYERPLAALDCLYKQYKKTGNTDHARTVQALLEGAGSSEPSHAVSSTEIVGLIKALQQSYGVNQTALFRIEWVYLSLLDGYSGARPKTLDSRLATDPDFFCEVVQHIYRSTHEHVKVERADDRTADIALNAYRLLNEWKVPPGTQLGGSFSATDFQRWLGRVKEVCGVSGHLEMALQEVGEVLIYSPGDPGGLWIHEAIASALNARDAEEMRRGLYLGFYNSRGVHFVDPTGAPELALAESYNQKADSSENAGFPRLAATLRQLAEGYRREARRIIDEHNTDDLE